MRELRSRQAYTKQSIIRRDKMAKAIYVQKLHRDEEI